MTATKVNRPVFQDIEPDLPECEIDEIMDSANCCEDAKFTVKIDGCNYKVCEDCKGELEWLFDNMGL